MKRITVLGAGTWGTALARMLSNTGSVVTVWSALDSEVSTLSETRAHPNLPGVELPRELIFTGSMEEACREMDLLLFAVPSPYVRETTRRAAPYIGPGQLIADAAKGIEAGTLLTMTGVIADELKKPGRGPQG